MQVYNPLSLVHTQAYTPEDNTVRSCMEGFQSGKADVVILDEPILRYQVIKYGKNADMRIVSGPSTIALSPAVAANKHNAFQRQFEQAAIPFFRNEQRVQTIKDRYFPTGAIVEELTEESWFSRASMASYIGSIMAPISLLTIYLTFYIIVRYYRIDILWGIFLS